MSRARGFHAGSSGITPGQPIPARYAYAVPGEPGLNLSPPLQWSGAPAGTKSFAVLVHDPDAPTGGAGWWHWQLVDIPSDVTTLAEGAGSAEGDQLPAGCLQLGNDYGEDGWGGPCPPAGDPPHRYNFTVYALKVARLDLPPGPPSALVGFLVNANALAQAGFTATYRR